MTQLSAVFFGLNLRYITLRARRYSITRGHRRQSLIVSISGIDTGVRSSPLYSTMFRPSTRISNRGNKAPTGTV